MATSLEIAANQAVTDQQWVREGKPVRYDIIDRQTKQVVGSCITAISARRSVDRRDNAYGAYRYTAKPVYQEGRR